MTFEERKERFYKFEGCLGVPCSECSYYGCGSCKDEIHEDARELLKHETLRAEFAEESAHVLKSMDEAANICGEWKPLKYEAPLSESDRELIRELVRSKTELPDLLAHFIQEINELCVCLNDLAALSGKLEQLHRGTDPAGGATEAELKDLINADISDAVEESADVFNYLFMLGYDHLFTRWVDECDRKLARWANRLNGVSDE